MSSLDTTADYLAIPVERRGTYQRLRADGVPHAEARDAVLLKFEAASKVVYEDDGRIWTHGDDTAAYYEGWGLFECSGSDNGPYQVQKFDSGDENGDGIPELETDMEAWEVMGYGRLPHHRRALNFLAVANPIEHLSIARWCAAAEMFPVEPSQEAACTS